MAGIRAGRSGRLGARGARSDDGAGRFGPKSWGRVHDSGLERMTLGARAWNRGSPRGRDPGTPRKSSGEDRITAAAQSRARARVRRTVIPLALQGARSSSGSPPPLRSSRPGPPSSLQRRAVPRGSDLELTPGATLANHRDWRSWRTLTSCSPAATTSTTTCPANRLRLSTSASASSELTTTGGHCSAITPTVCVASCRHGPRPVPRPSLHLINHPAHHPSPPVRADTGRARNGTPSSVKRRRPRLERGRHSA